MTTSPQPFTATRIQIDLTTPSCPPAAGEPSLGELPVSYEELLAKYKTLEQSQNNLLAQAVALKEKNDYWTRLYGYVEKGIALKIAELNTVKEANDKLRAKNTELAKTVDEVKEKMTKLPTSPAVLKRIQQLEDQVRARDLVIELMKKEETERKERQMQEMLDMNRRQMEAELGIRHGANGIPILNFQTPKLRITRTAKTGRKEPSRPRKKRKTNPRNTNNSEETGDTGVNPRPTVLSERGGQGDGSSNSTEVEDMEEIEQEFNDAFDELFDEE